MVRMGLYLTTRQSLMREDEIMVDVKEIGCYAGKWLELVRLLCGQCRNSGFSIWLRCVPPSEMLETYEHEGNSL